MTPDLIARLLRESLPVRLALLDAEPNGIGCFVPVVASEPGNCYVAMRVTPYERKRVQDGAAWLPANPLAIVEHAARLKYGTGEWCAAVIREKSEWYRALVEVPYVDQHEAYGSCPHTAALALLREVVG